MYCLGAVAASCGYDLYVVCYDIWCTVHTITIVWGIIKGTLVCKFLSCERLSLVRLAIMRITEAARASWQAETVGNSSGLGACEFAGETIELRGYVGTRKASIWRCVQDFQLGATKRIARLLHLRYLDSHFISFVLRFADIACMVGPQLCLCLYHLQFQTSSFVFYVFFRRHQPNFKLVGYP